jgi:hypothetical protein
MKMQTIIFMLGAVSKEYCQFKKRNLCTGQNLVFQNNSCHEGAKAQSHHKDLVNTLRLRVFVAVIFIFCPATAADESFSVSVQRGT